MEKIFFYDLETTGLDYNNCAIHQLSALIRIDGVIVEKMNLRIIPYQGSRIDEAALAISNITEKEIMANPMTYGDAYKYLTKVLGKYVKKFDKKDKFHLAGYNIMSFDNDFLRKMWDLNGDKFFGSYFWSDSIDVMSEASSFLRILRNTMENFKLVTVATKLRIPLDESRLHDALYDVELTEQIFNRINLVRKQVK